VFQNASPNFLIPDTEYGDAAKLRDANL
jgi:hypothetical protein